MVPMAVPSLSHVARDSAGGEALQGGLGQGILGLQRGSMSLQLREEARRGFAALADPRTVLLDVLESGRGWQRKGPSLEAWLTWELAHWLSAQPLPGLAQVSPAHGPTGYVPLGTVGSRPASPGLCSLLSSGTPGGQGLAPWD